MCTQDVTVMSVFLSLRDLISDTKVVYATKTTSVQQHVGVLDVTVND